MTLSMTNEEIQHAWNDWLPLADAVFQYYVASERDGQILNEKIRENYKGYFKGLEAELDKCRNGGDIRRLEIKQRLIGRLTENNPTGTSYEFTVDPYSERLGIDVQTLTETEFNQKFAASDLKFETIRKLDALAKEVNVLVRKAVFEGGSFEWKTYYKICSEAGRLSYEKGTFLDNLSPVTN